ncbi:MAG TPA: 50S ribosomal protein L11 methyltransferase [Candidatus Paceibacterota bacterium]|nr:50S ribosomal protein L11 methyltransferase [Candidatus Paceibacterota bacterium]
MIPKSFDVVGNIAILKFDNNFKQKEKISVANELLKQHSSIRTVLEKSGKFSGRLRKMKTVYLAGEKTKTAVYRENACIFKFDIDETYFSPRLSNERNEIAKQVNKNESVLVLFAGVAPFSIVIAKIAKPKVVYSVEINRVASKYAVENVKLNKVENIVKVIQGDVKKVIPKLIVNEKIKFDRIVMARPQLKDTFLDFAFKIVKKGGIINYYGFANDSEEVVESIKREAAIAKKKIKITLIKKAGDIAPFRYRWRVDLRVIN